ncbi:hypothetical protein C7B77_26580 [Chamaesiphon polymorphus CCALA 037]|uniref:Uncharacterized protein n=1 Tax=Chamaesiphon polymorphus CCALA 037 TaxID=2107692 RepID=A0A2T1FCM6_9CYAN|nr:hypothetical protein C7B77_26580 [Chamaesiphon polymorphus CCALA 037]
MTRFLFLNVIKIAAEIFTFKDSSNRSSIVSNIFKKWLNRKTRSEAVSKLQIESDFQIAI